RRAFAQKEVSLTFQVFAKGGPSGRLFCVCRLLRLWSCSVWRLPIAMTGLTCAARRESFRYRQELLRLPVDVRCVGSISADHILALNGEEKMIRTIHTLILSAVALAGTAATATSPKEAQKSAEPEMR